ncbi:MAG: hypothetical protein ABL901_14090 [Hyphomicrobiaceae bacterium]
MGRGLGLSVLLIGALAGGSARASAASVSWDRIANVEGAAKQIGEVQARGGVEKAFGFISACYKTHGLASAYSKAFEGCIAQDYVVSRTLVLIYERVPKDVLEKSGAPSPEKIDQSFKARAASAFAQYKRTPEDALALRGVVEQHGVPVFLKIVFPGNGKETPSPQIEKKQ